MSGAPKVSAEERAALLRLPVWTRDDIRGYFGLGSKGFWAARKAGDLPKPCRRLGTKLFWDRDEVLFGMSGDRGREVVGEGVGSGPDAGAGGGERPAPPSRRRPFVPDFAFLRGVPLPPGQTRRTRGPDRIPRKITAALQDCPEPILS